MNYIMLLLKVILKNNGANLLRNFQKVYLIDCLLDLVTMKAIILKTNIKEFQKMDTLKYLKI